LTGGSRLRTRMTRLCVCSLVAVTILGSAAVAAAQSTSATVFGTAADEQHAALPGVNITLRRLETGELRTATSDERGAFRIIGVAPGHYELRATLGTFNDVIAHLLVTEGFSSLEEIAYVAVEDLAEIEGFDVEVAAELQDRARNALERRDREYEERYHQLGVEDDLAMLEGLSPGMLVTFGENGIKTLEDFAGLAGDELVEMLTASEMGGAKLELEDANALIMTARVKAGWFEAEEAPAAEKESAEKE